MAVRKNKSKVKSKVCDDDRISQLPESLIFEILCYLPIKDAVRTSVLSTSWRYHWQFIPELDLNFRAFRNSNALVSFAERFIYSGIRKLKLCTQFYAHRDVKSFIAQWIEAVVTRKIQYLDAEAGYCDHLTMPLALYTSETLVHLRLSMVTLPSAEFVSLPSLRTMHLEGNEYPNEATLEKLISGSPILEDLVITSPSPLFGNLNLKAIQVRSQSLSRIYVDKLKVVIDAPLLQCFRTKIGFYDKNYTIVNLGFSTRLHIDLGPCLARSSFIRDILTDISKVKDLVIDHVIWKGIFLYHSKSRPLLQLCHLSRLNTKFSEPDLEVLPVILESCPVLESLILEFVGSFSCKKKNKEPPKVVFSTVPHCLASSLKFVELKRLESGYEGKTELVRYFLKNSRNLEELKLNFYVKKNAKYAFLKELLAMRRCSACEVLAATTS